MTMSISGTQIAHAVDEHGSIYVFEDSNSRTLSFDGHIEQSRMSLQAPDLLMHHYTQAMMSALIFLPAITSATIMGLGAGSLAKALLNNFKDIEIQAIEHRGAVIEIAKEYFHLPNNEQLQLITSDAVAYMRKNKLKSDLIFSDLYNVHGMEPRQIQSTYLKNCRNSLSKRGILVLNLWNQDFESEHEINDLLSYEFEDKTICFPVEGGNTIVLAFKNNIPNLDRKEIIKRGKQLQEQTNIPVARYAKLLWSHQQKKFSFY